MDLARSLAKMGNQFELGADIIPGGEAYLQQLGIPFRPNNPQLIELLRHGEPFSKFIHKVNAYSAAPAQLVADREPAPGTDQGHGAGRTWYFFYPATCHQNVGGGSTRMRQRAVGDGEFWRTEAGKKAVQDTAGGSTVGYTRTLYYVAGIKNSTGTSYKRLGWCMREYWLEQQGGGADQQLVLCKVYRSNRSDRLEASPAVANSAFGAAETPPISHRASSTEDPIPRPIPVAKDVDSVPCPCVPDPDPVRAAPPSLQNVSTCVTGGEGSPSSRRESMIQCESEAPAKAVAEEARDRERGATGLSFVMSLGGSSIPSAEGMKKIAEHIVGNCVVVLSAMGKTTINIQLAAEKAMSCSDQNASEIHELELIKELHLRTVFELGLDMTVRSIVSDLLGELEQNLQCVACTKELTPTKQRYLVSFGERMSTTIFSAYLNKLGKRTRQYAFDVGFNATDDFTKADIIEAAYPTIAKKLQGDWIEDSAITIVTSVFRKGCKSCSITLCSDLTAVIVGKALGSREIQIWKHFNGVFTSDPSICTNAIQIPNLTFDEATELAYSGAQVLHPQAIRLAIGDVTPIIKVKSACNTQAPGTMIRQTRDMSMSILSSIALKSNIVLFKINSTNVLSQQDFKAQVDSIFKDQQIYDHEAASGSNICLTLDLSNMSSSELIHRKLDSVVEELEKVANVSLQKQSIISLVGNVRKSSFILGKAFSALERIGVNSQKVSQRPSKVLNVSLVVHENEAVHCVQVLHSAFLEDGFVSKVEEADNECLPVPLNSFAAAPSSSGVKRKADNNHPEAPPSARQERAGTDPIGPEETERTTLSENDPMAVGDGSGGPLGASASEVQPEPHGLAEVGEGGSGRGRGKALDELERMLLSEDDPMQAGDDSSGCPEENWAHLLKLQPVGGGEQALPESAPGAVTEENAGQSSGTGTDGPEEAEHRPVSPDNDVTAVGGDNVGDLDEIFGGIINEDAQIEPLRGDHYQHQVPDGADDDLQTPIDVDLPTPIDVEVDEYVQRGPLMSTSARIFVSTSEDEMEQLAEGGSGLEVLLGEFSPDDLLGPSSS